MILVRRLFGATILPASAFTTAISVKKDSGDPASSSHGSTWVQEDQPTTATTRTVDAAPTESTLGPFQTSVASFPGVTGTPESITRFDSAQAAESAFTSQRAYEVQQPTASEYTPENIIPEVVKVLMPPGGENGGVVTSSFVPAEPTTLQLSSTAMIGIIISPLVLIAFSLLLFVKSRRSSSSKMKEAVFVPPLLHEQMQRDSINSSILELGPIAMSLYQDVIGADRDRSQHRGAEADRQSLPILSPPKVSRKMMKSKRRGKSGRRKDGKRLSTIEEVEYSPTPLPPEVVCS
ncbi:hypothetical protein BDR26DRAFT_852292 [Obelidium mucronatum]|nr:hypothetical protein BDR26DRAFT_852292 [Obelidium mucronatum]